MRATSAIPHDLRLRCPECRGRLSIDNVLHCPNGHEFQKRGSLLNLLPKSVTQLTIEEGRYHAAQRSTWEEQNQICAERNLAVHQSFLRDVAQRCHSSSHVLELGGGIGFDMELFLRMVPAFRLYVFSDVSMDLLEFAHNQAGRDKVLYCTVDAERSPFEDGEFDVVFMVAALHHLPDMHAALSEIGRVTKSGGVIAFGIEPNRWWLSLVKKMRWLLRLVLPTKEHSAADEEAPGLNRSDFEDLAAKHGLKVVRFEPVWFVCGFIHYGLELFYRIFRLKRRIRLPAALERLIGSIDRAILTIPGIREFSWHNSVVYQKL